MIFFILFLVNSQFDSLILQGIQYSYEENYDEAERNFREAIKMSPGDPAPYLFLAALYGLYMADFSTDTIEERFFAYSDTAVLMSEKRIESGDSSGLVHLWLAGGYGARAFYEVWHKDIISGIRDGIRSIKEFYKTIEIDSSLFDAYIGVGGYNYFKHKLLSFILWVKDSKWEEEIKLASEKGKYLRITASAGHALLLVEEKRYEEASSIASQLIEKFPNSRTFGWIRVKSYCGMEEWELARDEYEKLLKLTLAHQPGSYYNIGCCRIGLARARLMLGEFSECKVQCEEILKLPDAPKVKKIKEEAEKILQKLSRSETKN